MNGDHDDIIRLDEPLTYGEARQAAVEMSRLCRKAGEDLDTLVGVWKKAEVEYRTAYASEVRALRAAGEAATLIDDLAKGAPSVVEHLAERERLSKLIRSQVIRCHQLDGERALLRQIIEWSQHKLDPSGVQGRISPQTGEIITADSDDYDMKGRHE